MEQLQSQHNDAVRITCLYLQVTTHCHPQQPNQFQASDRTMEHFCVLGQDCQVGSMQIQLLLDLIAFFGDSICHLAIKTRHCNIF